MAENIPIKNKISKNLNLNQKWKYLGVLGALAGLLILSYYSVFAGMAFSYIFKIEAKQSCDWKLESGVVIRRRFFN